MRSNASKKSSVKETINSLKEFKRIYLLYPITGVNFFVSGWDKAISKNYSLLRRDIFSKFNSEKDIVNLIRKTPKHTWIFRKYLFETVFFLSILLFFINYLIFMPIFKGMLSFFIPIVVIIYYFCRKWVVGRLQNIGVIIDRIIEEIERSHSLFR